MVERGQLNNDEIGYEPEVSTISNLISNTVKLVPGPRKTIQKTIGHVWIAGSSTNAIAGTWTGTQDGQQLVAGPDGDGGRVETVSKVVNQNNKYMDLFNTTTYKDATTTATWSGNGQLTLTSGQFALSESIYKDTITINNAIITVDDDTNVTLELSADGGSNFETFTNDTLRTFNNKGTEILWKITATGNATINNLTIQYNL